MRKWSRKIIRELIISQLGGIWARIMVRNRSNISFSIKYFLIIIRILSWNSCLDSSRNRRMEMLIWGKWFRFRRISIIRIRIIMGYRGVRYTNNNNSNSSIFSSSSRIMVVIIIMRRKLLGLRNKLLRMLVLTMYSFNNKFNNNRYSSRVR